MRMFIKIVTAALPASSWRKKAREALLRWCTVVPHRMRGVLVITSSHNYKGTLLPYDCQHIVKPVRIGECVWIGDRVTILPGTVIEDGVVVQAGSVLHGRIPALSIVGGNPAKPFAARDPRHYNDLKQKGAYKW